MIKYSNKRVIIVTSISVIFILIMELYFFRGVLNTVSLIGDTGDGRLNNLLVEHWYKFFCGKESFGDLLAFYPAHNTITYSDMIMSFALPYSILRFLGMNFYLANKISIILIHCFGSFSLLYLLRNKFKMTPEVSFLGTVLCSYANSFAMKSTHTQMFTFSLVPLLLIFIYSYFENLYTNRKKRLIFGILAIIQFDLLLYTGFYIGYFFVLFSLILLVVFFIMLWHRKAKPIRSIISYVRQHPGEIILFIGIAILFTTPFLILYIPTSHQFGSRTWGEVYSFLPRIVDLVNVSEYNLFYGKLFKKLSITSLEQCTGFPFVTAFVFLLCFLYLVKHNKIKRREKATKDNDIFVCIPKNNHVKVAHVLDYKRIFIYAMAVSVLISLLVIVRVDKASLWWLFYKFLPGASALRALARYNLFLTLPVAIVTAFVIQNVSAKFERRKGIIRAGVILLCLFLIAENSISSTYISHWSSQSQAYINNVSAPPSDCKVMYIIQDPVDSSRSDYYNYQLDAWEIANRFDIKTVNGYSGQIPKQWDLWGVMQPNYMKGVDRWISDNGLKNVYSYNLATDEWTAYSSS